jgi:hypothetical protein
MLQVSILLQKYLYVENVEVDRHVFIMQYALPYSTISYVAFNWRHLRMFQGLAN